MISELAKTEDSVDSFNNIKKAYYQQLADKSGNKNILPMNTSPAQSQNLNDMIERINGELSRRMEMLYV